MNELPILSMPSFHRPQVSIVMPTFNRADLLPRAIDSVLAQTFTDWELIIVDDGSTDDSIRVIAPYLADARIKYLRHANRGPGLSRNAGMQASVGALITFLDSDDAYRPTHLEVRVRWLERAPEVDMIQGGFEVIGDQYVVDFDDPTRKISIYETAVGATFFGRREVFIELGGFNAGRAFEDTDLWRRAEARFQARSIDLPRTYEYHRQAVSLTAESLRQQAAGVLAV